MTYVYILIYRETHLNSQIPDLVTTDQGSCVRKKSRFPFLLFSCTKPISLSRKGLFRDALRNHSLPAIPAPEGAPCTGAIITLPPCSVNAQNPELVRPGSVFHASFSATPSSRISRQYCRFSRYSSTDRGLESRIHLRRDWIIAVAKNVTTNSSSSKGLPSTPRYLA